MEDERPVPYLDTKKYYAAVGELTSKWAALERLVDVAIWKLAEVDAPAGACITSQLPSIHSRFRTLLSLMHLKGRPEKEQKAARKLGEEAAALIMVRNRFAHNPTTFGLNDDMTDFQFFMSVIQAQNKLTFELVKIELAEVQKTINAIDGLWTRFASLKHQFSE